MKNPISPAWRLPSLLIGLSLVPVAATGNRLVWILSGGSAPDPGMTRYDGDWSALILHIVTGTVFLLLSAIQFSPDLRARYRQWHRGAGKLAMLAGLSAGLSGVWLIVAYPGGPYATPLSDGVRSLAGAALAASVLLAFRAIRRRDVASHRAWMMRAFALGVAGTPQALLIGIWIAGIGPLTPGSATALISLGFALNIAFAEIRIHVPRRALSPTA